MKSSQNKSVGYRTLTSKNIQSLQQRQYVVDATEDLIDCIGRPTNRSLRHEQDIGVSKPDFVGWVRPFSIQRSAKIKPRCKQSPILGATEDNDFA